MALKALRRSLKYRAMEKLGMPIKPIKLRFAVTKRCNARCAHCNAWKLQLEDPSIKEKELSLKEIEKILKCNRGFLSQVRSVSITGGEPFLRRDIGEIIAAILHYLPTVTLRLNTNGFLTDRILEVISESLSMAKKVVVNVSLDGIGKTHDSMRGVAGAYEKSVSTLEGLRSIDSRRLKVGVNFTLNDLNVNEVKEVYRMCREKGYKFNFLVPYHGHLYHSFGEGIKLGEEARRKALLQVKDMEEHNPRPEYSIIRGVLRGEGRPFRCWAGMVLLLVDYDGRVYPNSGCPDGWWLGDLREMDYDLRRVVSSPRGRTILKKVRECRACFLWCEAAPTLRHPEALYYKRLGGDI